jgi:hypothetical protein
MTVDQAKARLREIKSDIWLAIGYATEDRSTWSATGVLPQFDAGMDTGPYSFHDAEIHVPVFILAAVIDKAYSNTLGTFALKSPLREIKDKKTPIDQFSGEFFNLFFSPTGTGGTLYAIVRRRVYFSDASRSIKECAAADIALPQREDLVNGAINKYGRPSFVENEGYYTGLYWIYRRAVARSAERISSLSQCESRLLGADSSTPYNGTTPNPTLWSIKAGRNLTMNQLEVSFADREFQKLKYGDTLTSLSENISRIMAIVPQMVTGPYQRTPHDTFHEASFNECGTLVHTVVNPMRQPESQGLYASAITISLSDQRTTFFDNGIAEYMERQVRSLAPKALKAPPKEKY